MSDAPIEFIVAAFNDEDAAKAALKELKKAKKAHLIAIQDAAVITRDKKNKIHIKEEGGWTGGKGLATGGVLGVGIGLLTGGAGLVLGAAGAVIGGIIGKTHDSGFADDRLEAIGESLKPETSAIVAIIEHKWVADLEAEMEELGADVMTATIAADIATQLSEGKDVAISMLSTDESLDIDRTVVGEDSAEMSHLGISDDAIVMESGVANAEGVAFESTVITEDGIEETMGVVTEDAAILAAQITTEDEVVATVVAVVADEEE